MTKSRLIVYSLTAAVVCLVLGVLFLFIRTKPAVERLFLIRERRKAFSELLEINLISGLPTDFDFTSLESSIEYFEGTDNTGMRLVLARVIYPVRERGIRACSFVFDTSGRCVLWSKDSIMFLNGGLADLTGDGYLEKVVCYTEEGDDYRQGADRFQIFTMKSGKKEEIISVVYNLVEPSADFKNHFSLRVIPCGAGKPYAIELRRRLGGGETVKFVWSRERRSFIASKPESNNWRIVGIEGDAVVPTENSIRP